MLWDLSLRAIHIDSRLIFTTFTLAPLSFIAFFFLEGMVGLGIAAALLFGHHLLDTYGLLAPFVESLTLLLITAVVWCLWLFVRTRRQHVLSLEERAATLEREREHLALIAVAEERNRIAREIHDIIAHSLAVMVAQADGARYVLERSPETARQALEAIGDTGRQSLEEMRRLVGVLREEASSFTESVGREMPVMEHVDTLLERFRGSGLIIERVDVGESVPLTTTRQLTAYRIVQEALTNSLKHGGVGTRVTVTLQWLPADLAISVVDDGAGHVATAWGVGGHGLVGMRERVELFGGKLVARPRLAGGFEIVATLPLRS